MPFNENNIAYKHLSQMATLGCIGLLRNNANALPLKNISKIIFVKNLMWVYLASGESKEMVVMIAANRLRQK